MNILYLGDDSPGTTSRQRADALGRIGNAVQMANPMEAINGSLARWQLQLDAKMGTRSLQGKMRGWTQKVVERTEKAIDLVWVDDGALLGRSCLQTLRKLGCRVVLFNVDDPTGPRDGKRFHVLRQALDLYDLCVVVRPENIDECWRLGAKRVLRVWRSYDEVMHQPSTDPSAVPAEFQSEVAFIGTWMRHEGRDEFMLSLMEQGVPISIWGDRWKRSPMWEQLKAAYRGGSIVGADYVAAMQGAKVCLGLLSYGNRDLHTTRTFEIPYAGGLLCAQRTDEHEALFTDMHEAAFWSNAQECGDVCKRLLSDGRLRHEIKANGMRRVRELKRGNQDLCAEVLEHLG